MRLQTNSYGTNRDNKRKSIVFLIIVALIGLTACNPVMPNDEEEEEKKGTDYVIDDWGNHESGESSMNEGRDATHTDSIRLGIIPPDE